MSEQAVSERSRRRAADRISVVVPTRDRPADRISVVVPTRDRPGPLARCLAALATQDARELEVIVVDDGSRDRAAIAATLAKAPVPAAASAAEAEPAPLGAAAPDARRRIRLLHTPGRGPAAARNLGARAATGDVVCFTDDDCEPQPGWARLLAQRSRAAGSAAGRTLPPPGATTPALAWQAIVEHLQLASLDRASGALGFAPTCNLAATREALGGLPFDESFPGAAGEDREWSARALAAGLAPAYEPGAVVVHRQRLEARGFLAQQLRYGRGAARFRAAAGSGSAPPRFYAGLLRRGWRRGPAVGALVAAAQVATATGVVVERLSRRRLPPISRSAI